MDDGFLRDREIRFLRELVEKAWLEAWFAGKSYGEKVAGFGDEPEGIERLPGVDSGWFKSDVYRALKKRKLRGGRKKKK
jgi:hypothetical protein